MRRQFLIFSLTLLSTALIGCTSNLARPGASADYGKPPENYEGIIKEHFEAQLKDPDSARYIFSNPVKAYGNEGILYGGGIRWAGYLVKVEVNAKNSFGGYVGYEPYLVLFSGNAIYKVVTGDSHPLIHAVD